MNKQECLDYIKRSKDLQDDWDGIGALAPTAKSLAAAEALAHEIFSLDLREEPDISCGYGGDMYYEWFMEDLYIEATLSRNGQFTCWMTKNSTETIDLSKEEFLERIK